MDCMYDVAFVYGVILRSQKNKQKTGLIDTYLTKDAWFEEANRSMTITVNLEIYPQFL